MDCSLPQRWSFMEDTLCWLCVLWDHCGIIHFDFLNRNQTLNTNLYSQLTQRVHETLRKRPALVSWRNVVILCNIKDIELNLVCSTPSIIFTWPFNKRFPTFSFSTKWEGWQKIFQEDQVKTFMENILSSKPAEFYGRGIN